MFLNPTSQIGQRAALTNKVVYQKILLVSAQFASKTCLTGQAAIATGAGVGHDIGLHDGGLKRHFEALAQQFRQSSRNGVHALVFIRVDTNQYGSATYAD